MEEFQKKLFEKYSIEVYESHGMISYLLPDRQNPIRVRSLGIDFEKDFIRRFISTNRVSIRKAPNVTAEKGKTAIRNPFASQTKPKRSVRLITDLETCINARQNRAYAQKVKISNLQKMADTLAFLQTNDIGTMEELQELGSSSKAHVKETLAAVKATEARLHVVDKMYQARLSILKNRDVYKQYLNAPNRKKFRESHAAEILLYEAARKELQELTGEKKFPPLKDIKAERSALYRQKHSRYEDYSDARAHDRELENIEANVRSILDLQKEEPLISKTLS